jgi:hypothetical protein
MSWCLSAHQEPAQSKKSMSQQGGPRRITTAHTRAETKKNTRRRVGLSPTNIGQKNRTPSTARNLVAQRKSLPRRKKIVLTPYHQRRRRLAPPQLRPQVLHRPCRPRLQKKTEVSRHRLRENKKLLPARHRHQELPNPQNKDIGCAISTEITAADTDRRRRRRGHLRAAEVYRAFRG